MAMYFGQLVVGPAGSGKSTYCYALQDMAENLKRNIMVINLDPAAETFKYKCDIDIRDLITLDDVMEELKLGPNGGLIYCMEYLIENIDWIQEQIGEIGQDDYVLFDLPGQIELYTHLDLMNKLIKTLTHAGFNLCSMYMLDVTFTSEHSKFISGVLCALTTMMQLGLPHLTVMTKCDLMKDKKMLDKYLDYAENIESLPLHKQQLLDDEKYSSGDDIDREDQLSSDDEQIQKLKEDIKNIKIEKTEVKKPKTTKFDQKYQNLTKMLQETVADQSMVSMKPLDITDEESIKALIADADTLVQFGENREPDEKIYEKAENYLDQYYGGGQLNEDQEY